MDNFYNGQQFSGGQPNQFGQPQQFDNMNAQNFGTNNNVGQNFDANQQFNNGATSFNTTPNGQMGGQQFGCPMPNQFGNQNGQQYSKMPNGMPQSAIKNTDFVKGPKNRIVAILLALFTGGVGGHNFYLAYTQKAILQLAITLLAIIVPMILNGLGMPYFIVSIVRKCKYISSVWALIDAYYIYSGKISVDGVGQSLV